MISNKDSKLNNKSMSSQKRTLAFNIMANTKNRENLYYTKLCKSVKLKSICHHGDKCKFAHSIEQLCISNCVFGENCRFVIKRDGIFINKIKTKICNHIHPEETQENYYNRINNISPLIYPVQILKKNTNETILKVTLSSAVEDIQKSMEDGNTNIKVELI